MYGLSLFDELSNDLSFILLALVIGHRSAFVQAAKASTHFAMSGRFASAALQHIASKFPTTPVSGSM
jgi:hypothetical protein